MASLAVSPIAFVRGGGCDRSVAQLPEAARRIPAEDCLEPAREPAHDSGPPGLRQVADAQAHRGHRDDGGNLVAGGRNLSALAPAARGLGYVPQSYGLFPHLDVIGQLCFPSGIDAESLAHWVDRLDLRDLERRFPSAFSMEQQQRVALARALSRRTHLLLLDERFSALDAPLRSRLREEFLSLQREFPGTTVMVTHDPVRRIARR
ncbi:MAG: ATP-binding cassette domain-containing protein [Steroidobacteraceae bacterium]